MYSFLNKQIEKPYSEKTLTEHYTKILITMTPILPHFATECLSMIKIKKFKWPEYDKSILDDEETALLRASRLAVHTARLAQKYTRARYSYLVLCTKSIIHTDPIFFILVKTARQHRVFFP